MEGVILGLEDNKVFLRFLFWKIGGRLYWEFWDGIYFSLEVFLVKNKKGRLFFSFYYDFG